MITLRHRFILMTITIVLMLQFAVPAIQFFSEGSNRWGWQMYSRENLRPEIVAVSPDRTRQEISLSDHVVHVRAELRIDRDVIDQLCARLPEVEEFELVHPSTDEITVFPCHE